VINNIFEPDIADDDYQSSVDSQDSNINDIEAEFTEILDNILADIDNIDTKIADLQRYIVILDNNIEMLERRIRAEKDTAKRANMQRVLNGLMEMMIKYQEGLQKFLKLKHDYRMGQLLGVRHKNKLKLDAIKARKNVQTDMSVGNLIDLLKSLHTTITTNKESEREIIESLEELEEDDIYSLK